MNERQVRKLRLLGLQRGDVTRVERLCLGDAPHNGQQAQSLGQLDQAVTVRTV